MGKGGPDGIIFVDKSIIEVYQLFFFVYLFHNIYEYQTYLACGLVT